MIRRVVDRLAGRPRVERQSEETFRRAVTREIGGRYLLYVPSVDAPPRGWPLVVFLHGSGERGADVAAVARHGPPKLIAAGRDVPAIVVSPQADADHVWSTWTLHALIDEVASRLPVDDDRVLLTGLSMGGHGIWDLAMEFPRRFAALAPVSAHGNPSGVCLLRHVPVWAFHGAGDDVVPLDGAQRLVDELLACGGDVRFTVYPELGHDAWTRAYDDPALLEWLLRQRRA